MDHKNTNTVPKLIQSCSFINYFGTKQKKKYIYIYTYISHDVIITIFYLLDGFRHSHQ